MTFKELLQSVTWESVENELVKISDNLSVEAYEQIFYKLLSYEPSKNTDGMTINAEYIEDDEDKYVDITGINDKGDRYGLDFTDWKEWLGYNVNIGDLNKYEFVASCLWEMTFYGNEDDMLKKRKELEEESEKLRNGQYVKREEDCFICEGTGIYDGTKCVCDNGKMTVVDTDI